MGRSGAHYIPRQDDELSAWADQFEPAVLAWWESQSYNPGDLDPLIDAVTAWREASAAQEAALAAARAATQRKNAAREALEAIVRPLVRFVQANPNTRNRDRAEMGITVKSDSATPAPPPATSPVPLVQAPARLTHTVRLVDTATPTRTARPQGVARAEVYMAVGSPQSPPPMDLAEYRYMTSITKGAATLRFTSEQSGQRAHYIARWINARGEAGPWSNAGSATVAA